MELAADNLVAVLAVYLDCNIAVEVIVVTMRMMWPNEVMFDFSAGNLFAVLYCHRTYCCLSNRVVNCVVANLVMMFAS